MNDQQHAQQEVELSIEDAKKEMAKLASMKRLLDNPDFKEVIEKGYFEDEASRLVLVKHEPAFENDKMQARIARQIDAIGTFRQFITASYSLGLQLEKSLADDQETLLGMHEGSGE